MAQAFEAVIGLEVHVQLSTRSKMFCACENATGGEPNSRTCPVCLGLPGALPALNAEAVQRALSLGLALGCEIQPRSTFFRKQYFYADLPKGYQITQGELPLLLGGAVEIPGDPAVRGGEGRIRIGLERVHLEEDAGKSTHDQSPGASLVDLNRAGVPLLEVVGLPELRSPLEASEYFKALHQLVVWLGLSEGNLEEGHLRCDANLSLRPVGSREFGTRVEVKNLNSFRYLRQALDHEMERQAALLQAGERVLQETRGWDAQTGQTLGQRSKEAAMDYRYFPEPDLPPLLISAAEIEACRAALPELPAQRHRRFREGLGLSEFEAATLLQDRALSEFYENLLKMGAPPKAAANWMLGEVSRSLNERGCPLAKLGLCAEDLAALIGLVEARTINLTTAREAVYPALLAGEGTPAEIVARKGLGLVADPAAVEALVAGVLAAHPQQVAELKAGKGNLRGFLVGQVMKAGQGKVDAKLVNRLLDEALAAGGERHG